MTRGVAVARRSLLAVATGGALVLALADPLQAQTRADPHRSPVAASPFDLLGETQGMLLCQTVPVSPADSLDIVISLSETGPAIDRTIVVGFDSAGTPRQMMVQAMEHIAEDTVNMHELVAVFDSVGRGTRAVRQVVAGDSTAASTEARRAKVSVVEPLRNLEADALVRARTRAVWLWDSGCGRQRKP